MRISKERGWLAVLALAVGVVEGDRVSFTYGFEGTFENKSQAIIAFGQALYPTRRFLWTASGMTVERVNLYQYNLDNKGSIQLTFAERSQDNPHSLGPGGGHSTSTTHPSPLSTTPKGNISMELTEDGGNVFFFSTEGISSAVALYFEAVWTGGTSYSRLFTFLADSDSSGYKELAKSENFGSSAPIKPEIVTSTSSPTISVHDDQPPDATNAASPSGNSDAKNSSGGNSGGNSGLSSGAVVGIAVACGVIGLGLIFAVVWWFVRRHRHQKELLPVNSSYGSANRTEDLMAQKEAGAEVDATPHSPYSDEGASGTGPGGAYHDRAAHGDAAIAAGAAGSTFRPHPQDQTRSFTPYSDRPIAGPGTAAAGTPSVRAASLAHTEEPHVSVPSPTPGRATPRALSTPYAHLVEDGMTEEEIRRLEEEERQLDAAIEQAGRRSQRD
ncbi:hypothetical protein VTI74DRAFT_464 [Chaetomium olivicolor]